MLADRSYGTERQHRFTVRLRLPETAIKRVEEALAKYRTVNEALEEIRKLSPETYKRKANNNSDPKKIVSEQ